MCKYPIILIDVFFSHLHQSRTSNLFSLLRMMNCVYSSLAHEHWGVGAGPAETAYIKICIKLGKVAKFRGNI